MRPVAIIIALYCGLLISCYKPYFAEIESDDKILVVEGLITNEVAPYSIHLSYATPFYSEDTLQPVKFARVYVTDDSGNTYLFRDMGDGSYRSDPWNFTGQPGKNYMLHIVAPDGEIYNSELQRLSQESYPDSIYGEFDTREALSRLTGLVVQTEGANIMLDIRSSSKSPAFFRIDANLVKQYFYALEIPPPGFDPPMYLFYCWETENIKYDINIADKGYSSSVPSFIKKQEIYFVEDQYFFEAVEYTLGQLQPDLTYQAVSTNHRQTYTVVKRILYIDLYTINIESYSYYESMDKQLSSEGRLFDPIAAQLEGNIKCLTNPDIKVLGFFEASAVTRASYVISFRDKNIPYYVIKKIPYITPPQPNGCWINKVPPFWVR